MSLISFENFEVKLSNSFDVRPYVQEIMERINWLEERLPEDVPIVILIGENHSVSSHKVVYQAILQQLRGRNYSHGYELSRSSHQYGAIEQRWTDYADLLNFTGHAQLALTSVYRECLNQENFGHPNDISIYPDPIFSDQAFIDENDIQSLLLIMRYFPNSERPILRGSSTAPCADGVALSNYAIVENALAHLRSTQARLYVQNVGSAHTVETTHTVLDQDGNLIKSETHKMDTSLSKLFSKKGCVTVTIIPYTNDENTQVKHNLTDAQNVIIARGLDQQVLRPDFAAEAKALKEQYRSPEDFYLSEMQRSSGGFYTFHR